MWGGRRADGDQDPEHLGLSGSAERTQHANPASAEGSDVSDEVE